MLFACMGLFLFYQFVKALINCDFEAVSVFVYFMLLLVHPSVL